MPKRCAITLTSTLVTSVCYLEMISLVLICDHMDYIFGKPSDYFKGYNDKQSFVAAFGLPLPVDTVQALAKGVGEDMEVINSIEDEFVSI